VVGLNIKMSYLLAFLYNLNVAAKIKELSKEIQHTVEEEQAQRR